MASAEPAQTLNPEVLGFWACCFKGVRDARGFGAKGSGMKVWGHQAPVADLKAHAYIADILAHWCRWAQLRIQDACFSRCLGLYTLLGRSLFL